MESVIIKELTNMKLAFFITKVLKGTNDNQLAFRINESIKTYFKTEEEVKKMNDAKKYIREQYKGIIRGILKKRTEDFVKEREFHLGGRIDAMYNLCTRKDPNFDFYGTDMKTYETFLFKTSVGDPTFIYTDIESLK